MYRMQNPLIGIFLFSCTRYLEKRALTRRSEKRFAGDQLRTFVLSLPQSLPLQRFVKRISKYPVQFYSFTQSVVILFRQDDNEQTVENVFEFYTKHIRAIVPQRSLVTFLNKLMILGRNIYISSFYSQVTYKGHITDIDYRLLCCITFT